MAPPAKGRVGSSQGIDILTGNFAGENWIAFPPGWNSGLDRGAFSAKTEVRIAIVGISAEMLKVFADLERAMKPSTASEKLERRKTAILKVLKQAGGPLSSTEIARRLRSEGLELSERTVRVYLQSLDSEGFTERVGKSGRRITKKGEQELELSRVFEKVGFLEAKIDQLAYRMTFSLEKLEVVGGKPHRFVEIIAYNGTSIDPLEIFVRSGMTDYKGAVETGMGRIGVGFREFPAESRERVAVVASRLERVGLGGFMAIRWPGQPLVGIPVGEGRFGAIVIGGLNPAAIVEELGMSARSKALAGLLEYEKLISYHDLEKELLL